jgi:transposase
MQLHVHSQIAHTARTTKDGKWRAPDSLGYNEHMGAVAAIVSQHLEEALTQRFGLEWTARDDGHGFEIKGISGQMMRLFSSRRESITADLRVRAARFEQHYGHAPSQRELAQLAQASNFRGLFASLCPSCRCVIRWICGVTAGRRAWPCLDSPVNERKRYPSDLTDERWALIEPVITAWKAAHRSVSGHQGGYEMREIVNAILYQSRTGCQWDYLPHDLPPRSAAYYYFARWRDDGTDQAICDLLRWHAREKAGRKADPSLVVLDTQSVHAAASVPADTTGKDAGKKVPGRKRCLAVDVLGLVVAVVVLAASAHENTAGIALLDQVAARTSTVSKALVDQGFKNSVAAHGATMGIDVEVVERNAADRGFVPQPKRWVVEQTFGILSFHRRLVRDYEHRLSSSASRVYWAMTDVMARRLTGTSAPSWRPA